MKKRKSVKNQRRSEKVAQLREKGSNWIVTVLIVMGSFIGLSIGDLIGYNRTTGVSNPITFVEYFGHMPIIISISIVLGIVYMSKHDMF